MIVDQHTKSMQLIHTKKIHVTKIVSNPHNLKLEMSAAKFTKT